MRIALAADHAGFELKQKLLDLVSQLQHVPIDLGTHTNEPVDYPDFAAALADHIRRGAADRGLLLCGSGVGASVVSNRFSGIRAGLCHDTYSAHQGVEHDDMNVLVLGARVIGVELARELVRAFLAANFTGEQRHQRRLAKLREIEQRLGGSA